MSVTADWLMLRRVRAHGSTAQRRVGIRVAIALAFALKQGNTESRAKEERQDNCEGDQLRHARP